MPLTETASHEEGMGIRDKRVIDHDTEDGMEVWL